LENSCHDRRNRWHTPRRNDILAQQKVRHATVTGNSAELFRRDQRTRNYVSRSRRNLSRDKRGTDKSADSVNRFPFEFRAIARIF
jgi:hypothetical protein